MSLFHSTPVTVQRTYYKPSAMSRLRALFSSRRRTAVPVATRTTHQRRRRPVRQPVRKTGGGFGLFRRTPRARRTVVTPQRRRGGLFASLRPRRHYGRTRVAPAPRQHHHHGKGRTFATVLAALSLRKHRHRHGAYGGAPMRPRY